MSATAAIPLLLSGFVLQENNRQHRILMYCDNQKAKTIFYKSLKEGDF